MMNQTLQVKTKCICRQDALQIQCTWVLHDIKCRYMILRYCSDAAFQLTPAGFCAHIAKKKRIMPTDRTFFCQHCFPFHTSIRKILIAQPTSLLVVFQICFMLSSLVIHYIGLSCFGGGSCVLLFLCVHLSCTFQLVNFPILQ